jgi:hypothetical protein
MTVMRVTCWSAWSMMPCTSAPVLGVVDAEMDLADADVEGDDLARLLVCSDRA